MNPKKCQDLCIEEEECSIFSLISHASKQRDPGCELKKKLSSKSSLNANVGTVISGLAKCPSKICVNNLILLKSIFVLAFLQFMVNGQNIGHGYHAKRELKKDSGTVITPNRSSMEMTVLEATLSYQIVQKVKW